MPASEAPPVARPAATVIVARPAAAPGGPAEILLLQRSRRAGFFPSAWVFPGGRVDAADGQAVARGAVRGAVQGLPAADQAFGVAAVRETFEEAGVWLGEGPATPALRDRLNARTATLDDAPALVAHLDRMWWWSWWITPEAEPKRYDTRFFLCIVDRAEAEHAAHDDTETVRTRWLSAAAALAAHAAGGLALAPPTFRTLTELAAHPDPGALAAAAAARRPQPIQPRLRPRAAGGVDILLPGDPLHPATPAAPGPSRILWCGDHWEDGGP